MSALTCREWNRQPGKVTAEHRDRLAVVVAAAAILLGVLGGMFRPGNLANHPVANPLGVPAAGPVFDLLEPVFLGLVVLATPSSLASLAARWRRARAVERQQLDAVPAGVRGDDRGRVLPVG